MNKHISMTVVILCLLSCSILQSLDIPDGDSTGHIKTMPAYNPLIPQSQDELAPFMKIIEASPDAAREMYFDAQNIFTDRKGAGKKYTLDEQFIIALCSGRYDILESFPNRKTWLSNMFKSSKTLYVNDLFGIIVNDYSGDTPLHLATRIAAYHNINIMHTSNDAERRIEQDKYDNMLKVIKFLAENNADINAQNKQLKTALHIACKDNDSGSVATLLIHDADPTITDKQQRTPLSYAEKNYKSYSQIRSYINKAIQQIKKRQDEITQKNIDASLKKKLIIPVQMPDVTPEKQKPALSINTESIDQSNNEDRFTNITQHAQNKSSWGSTGDEIVTERPKATNKPKATNSLKALGTSVKVVPNNTLSETFIIDNSNQVTISTPTIRPITAQPIKKAPPINNPPEKLLASSAAAKNAIESISSTSNRTSITESFSEHYVTMY